MSSSKPSLSTIPVVLLVKITSFLSFQQKHVSLFALLNKSLRTVLRSPAFWHVLSKTTWARNELYSQLPVLSPQGLYSILEKYSSLEGFHTLLTPFPWCLLCVCRFSEGKFIGEAVRFDTSNVRSRSSSQASISPTSRASNAPTPQSHNRQPSTPSRSRFFPTLPPSSPSHKRTPTEDGKNSAEEVLLPIFSISFTEEKGVVQEACVLHADPTLPVTIDRGLSPVPYALQMARNLFDPSQTVHPGYISAREGITITAQSQLGFRARVADKIRSLLPTNNNNEALSCDEAWSPDFVGGIGLQGQTDLMIMSLVRDHGLAFGLLTGAGVHGPVPDLASVLTQGLYVGNYGRSFYGQFKHEVLRLSYVTFEAGEGLEERLATVFARNGEAPQVGQIPAALLTALKEWQAGQAPADRKKGVSLLVVRKVTGDAHVCAGATTFVAVCAPQEFVNHLSSSTFSDMQCEPPPSEIRCNLTNQQVTVLEAWRGWGTLAFAGLRSPSWNPGWLLGCQDGRFGFIWDRERRDGAILLQLISAHHQSLFLDRRYLPPSLQ